MKGHSHVSLSEQVIFPPSLLCKACHSSIFCSTEHSPFYFNRTAHLLDSKLKLLTGVFKAVYLCVCMCMCVYYRACSKREGIGGERHERRIGKMEGKSGRENTLYH